MLKKKSSRRPVTKQSLMADPFSLPSPTAGYKQPPTSPLFPLSPRVFVGFSPKVADFDAAAAAAAAMSPTSTLEPKPFSFTDVKEPVGLGIVDALEKPAGKPDGGRPTVLFGSQLRIQIPANGLLPHDHSPQSPIEFGVKNKEAQLALLSPAAAARPSPPAGLVSLCLSASEMEMSEDYTCVIAHGPNPRTTHIFDNCVVEKCGGAGFTAAVTPRKEGRVPDDFLTCCHACKKRLGQDKDIFMYRGEKAFCSSECRYQEMLFDEGVDDCSEATAL